MMIPVKNSVAVCFTLAVFAFFGDCDGAIVEKKANDYDKPSRVDCPSNAFVGTYWSVHSNRKEDRVYTFRCHTSPVYSSLRSCSWTGFENDFDKPLTFSCNRGYVSGIYSEHSNRREDRRFQFKCCRNYGVYFTNCYHTGWLNEMDGIMDYTVPGGKVVTGVSSYHSNKEEDRRWKLLLCTPRKS